MRAFPGSEQRQPPCRALNPVHWAGISCQRDSAPIASFSDCDDPATQGVAVVLAIHAGNRRHSAPTEFPQPDNMTDHLKLFAAESNTSTLPAPRSGALLQTVQQAFTQATGWELQTELVDDFDVLPGATADGPPRRVRLAASAEADRAGVPRIERGRAQQLGVAIQNLAADLRRTQRALWQREAELAAGVPVSTHRDEREHLATRLTAVLKEGSRILGCHAAAVYMLDGNTMQLKLRTAWNIPRTRLLAPARSLDSATADVEALSDVAVAIESEEQAVAWRAPEPCAAAICVRIASSTMPLGTLWFFHRRPRAVRPRQLALARVIAGRIAAELEREVLLAETQSLVSLRGQLQESAQSSSAERRPAPQLDRWSIAGWTRQESGIGAAFHAWDAPQEASLWSAVGECNGRRLAAALRAAALSASLQASWRRTQSPAALLTHVNAQLLQRESGDAVATLAAARLTGEDKVLLSVAGDPCVLLLTETSAKELVGIEPPLGLAACLKPTECKFRLPRGAALVLATSGVRDALDARGRLLGAKGIVKALHSAWSTKSQVLADALGERLDAHTQQHTTTDCAAVIICRR